MIALSHYTPNLTPNRLPRVEIPGLYVHIPFCFHKCHYCDFYSITQQTPERMQQFVSLILREARQWVDLAAAPNGTGPSIRPRTIFFGGGTPTLLPAQCMVDLITGLQKIFDLSQVREWTIEANPATVDQDYCAMLRNLGVDRLSFGAQSFDKNELKMLERHHDPADVDRSIASARDAGFSRLNVDLIFAIPGQTMQSWTRSLEKAISLGTSHLSAYNLTYEPNTAMTVKKRLGQIQPTDQDTELAMLHQTRRRLTEIGIPPYEISNFAAPGQECQHNLLYWTGGDYIGLGPAAASHVQGHRWKNAANLGQWETAIAEDRLPVIDLEILTPNQRAGELAMLTLRLTRGLNFSEFTAQTGLDAREFFMDPITRLANHDLLTIDATGIRLTGNAINIADAIAAEFL